MEFLLRNAHERDVASFDLLGPVFVDVLTASASAESLSPTTPCFSVPAPSTHLKAPTKPARGSFCFQDFFFFFFFFF